MSKFKYIKFTQMPLLIIIDANSLAPNKNNFLNIDKEKEFKKFWDEQNSNKDYQSFYFTQLWEFIFQFKKNIGDLISSRFIIYVSNRGVFSGAIEKILSSSNCKCTIKQYSSNKFSWSYY